MAPRADAAAPVTSARLTATGRGVVLTHAGPLQTEASLESHQRMVADKLSVSELMTTQLVALEPVMRVRPAPGQLLPPWALQCASPCQPLPCDLSVTALFIDCCPCVAGVQASAMLLLPALECCQ